MSVAGVRVVEFGANVAIKKIALVDTSVAAGADPGLWTVLQQLKLVVNQAIGCGAERHRFFETVSTCPESLRDSEVAENRTNDLSIVSPTP